MTEPESRRMTWAAPRGAGARVGVWVERLLLASLSVALLGTAIYFLWSGWSYYSTPLALRARHEQYWELKPGGALGLRFGITGAAMMVVMLAYTLRKRVPLLRRWGPIATWLNVHILLGVCGPVFILLHSSFKVGGIVSLSFWSMVAVALSGVMGRYLYRLIPHTQTGDELSLAEAERLDDELSLRLVEEFGLEPGELASLDALVERGVIADRSLLTLLLTLPWHRWTLASRLRQLERRHPQVHRTLRRELADLVRRKGQLRLRIALWQRVRKLFHYWHVFHKPFAVIMYLFMIVHVAVAWMTGYGWVSR